MEPDASVENSSSDKFVGAMSKNILVLFHCSKKTSHIAASLRKAELSLMSKIYHAL